MPEITDEQIAINATKPQSSAVDGRSASAHSISDQIKARQHKAAADAVEGTNPQGGAVSGWATLRPARVVPPGAAT